MNIIRKLIKKRYERSLIILRLRYNKFDYLITLDCFIKVLGQLKAEDQFLFFEKGWKYQNNRIERVKQILVKLDNILTANYETIKYIK